MTQAEDDEYYDIMQTHWDKQQADELAWQEGEDQRSYEFCIQRAQYYRKLGNYIIASSYESIAEDHLTRMNAK